MVFAGKYVDLYHFPDGRHRGALEGCLASLSDLLEGTSE